MKIAIIGGGNLGMAMAEGFLTSGLVKPADLFITRRNIQALHSWSEKGVRILSDNIEAVKKAELILLAVKPYQVEAILQSVKKYITNRHQLVSVITGVSLNDLQTMIGKKNPLFRAMPNTAIAIAQSMTCVSSSNASPRQVEYVKQLFETVGKVALIEDGLMDAATVLGACGTAYAMRYIRANIQGGIEIGFDSATANLIAAQTVRGAAELLLQKGTHPEYEIDKVTTPKGCTIAGLNEMEHQGFSSSLIKGIATSFARINKK